MRVVQSSRTVGVWAPAMAWLVRAVKLCMRRSSRFRLGREVVVGDRHGSRNPVTASSELLLSTETESIGWPEPVVLGVADEPSDALS